MGKISFRLYRRSKASGASETHYSLRAMRCDTPSLMEVTTTRFGIEPWWKHSSGLGRSRPQPNNLPELICSRFEATSQAKWIRLRIEVMS
jgi:hypothetical protein